MTSEGFLRRWARLKGSGNAGSAEPRPAASGQPGLNSGVAGGQAGHVAQADPSETADRHGGVVARPAALPTLDDVTRLTPESDYSAFVAQGVAPAVRRQALKKLFSDPHFNSMDGLDIYMGDYNRVDPLPASMLAALRQAQGFLQQPGMEPDEGAAQHADSEGGVATQLPEESSLPPAPEADTKGENA